MVLTPTPAVKHALALLKRAGFSAYLVGGCVRDAVLGLSPHDFDVATNALPEDLKRVFAAYTLILAGEKHGTVAAVVMGEVVEMTTFRIDGNYADGRHPTRVAFTDDLTQDLSRRDFTINAMAYSEETGLVDPFMGVADCARGIVRCVGEADKRFEEDALRILRALRFAARYGFEIEEGTACAIMDKKALLAQISVERIAIELTGILTGAHAARVLHAFWAVLFFILPELSSMRGCPQQCIYHCHDVWEHTLATLECVTPRTPLTCFSALMHDVGKPATRTRDAQGQDHFARHQEVGERIAGEALKRLKLPVKFIKQVTTLVRYHDEALSRQGLPLLLHHIGSELLPDFVALKRADWLAHSEMVACRVEALEAVYEDVQRDVSRGVCFERRALKVKGDDLMALGYQNKGVGQALDMLLDDVMQGRVENTREALLRRAQEEMHIKH